MNSRAGERRHANPRTSPIRCRKNIPTYPTFERSSRNMRALSLAPHELVRRVQSHEMSRLRGHAHADPQPTQLNTRLSPRAHLPTPKSLHPIPTPHSLLPIPSVYLRALSVVKAIQTRANARATAQTRAHSHTKTPAAPSNRHFPHKPRHCNTHPPARSVNLRSTSSAHKKETRT